MKPIIEVNKIGKKYDIKHYRGNYVALRDVLMNVLRSPFRFFKEKAKSVVGLSTKEEFWALKDVSFNIMPGEVVGIIGRNGAGKSTLLKILTGITPPTTGEIKMNGRVASLLEVGTGFHPELTGRENIFLNGAILGMTRKEIIKSFDSIVEFAEIEQFLDTPVKYYSSGMYVRLAFSVASHMEPDILLVDEVLAVGDAEFQKKCMGKMEEVTNQEGRTILFVSHNLDAISSICKRSILLEKGKVAAIGNTQDIIETYLKKQTDAICEEWVGEVGDEHIKIHKTYIKSLDKNGQFQTAADLEIAIEGELIKPTRDLILGFTLFSEFGYELAYSLYDDNQEKTSTLNEPGKFKKRFIIPANTLAHGSYKIEFDVGIHRTKRIVGGEETALNFTLLNTAGLGRRFPLPREKGRSSFFRPDWYDHSNEKI